MLYREIMAVCSEIHTKHINTVCGQNVELLNVKLVVHIVTSEVLKDQSATTYRLNLLLHDLHVSPKYLTVTTTHKLSDTYNIISAHKHRSI
jgi:hypothetical protein